MICENYFCIYQENGKCILDEIELDINGQCVTCIYPDIDNEILKQAKVNLLEKFNNYNY